MARLSNTATAAERREAHAAKMAGKKYDAARRFATQPTRLQASLARVPAGAFGRMARANRHTLDPHTNAREIERRIRQVTRINNNRESRLDETGTQTRGVVLAGCQAFNFSRRGRLVPVATA
ncbi:hypothetical protein [Sphingomonas sp. ACRSK]|uniref:hypothetical protein n=1 Tax=Sphingomonas sp. ACRSK TaxID=2918213 RepID=UPI001EF4B78A|nr:hypothetical protein [Sphingomonas sp. ACRSK]MCG7348899.1 hypothetical protein [Sphingomonas sp. ACRSK]